MPIGRRSAAIPCMLSQVSLAAFSVTIASAGTPASVRYAQAASASVYPSPGILPPVTTSTGAWPARQSSMARSSRAWKTGPGQPLYWAVPRTTIASAGGGRMGPARRGKGADGDSPAAELAPGGTPATQRGRTRDRGVCNRRDIRGDGRAVARGDHDAMMVLREGYRL